MGYDYREITEYLLQWFSYNARILAWRSNPQPYYVWVSEIMLQQTRVEAVKTYFDRFVTELPDIGALADCEEERLLKLWEGLGYYNRVRNLQKAAQIVMEEYDGKLPSEKEELMKLPGIGSYTAGAIASIAYGKRVPAVDGNVLRVTKRIAGSFDDITKDRVKREVEQDILEAIPLENPGIFNQAMMELGAMVCLPNGAPLCEQCPVMHLCKAFHEDTWSKIPVKPKKRERKIEKKTILLLEQEMDGRRYGIRKRKDVGLLNGLWEFPSMEGMIPKSAVMQEMVEQLKLPEDSVQSIEYLGKGKHIFSHIEWRMIGYHILLKKKHSQILENLQWVSKEELDQSYSVPSAFEIFKKKIL